MDYDLKILMTILITMVPVVLAGAFTTSVDKLPIILKTIFSLQALILLGYILLIIWR